MKQQRAESTRARLVRAAVELFGERGYVGTNINDVTRGAGVTKGALYFHFAGKDELVAAVASEVDRALEELCARVYHGGVGDDAQVLIDLTHLLGRELASHPYLRAGFRLARECGGRGRPFHDAYLTWSAIVSRAVSEVAERKGLADDAACESVSMTVLAISVGLEALLAADLPAGDPSKRLADIWRLVLPEIVPGGNACELRPEGGDRAFPPGPEEPSEDGAPAALGAERVETVRRDHPG